MNLGIRVYVGDWYLGLWICGFLRGLGMGECGC